MSVKINNEEIVVKMSYLPTATKQDVVSALMKSENLNDNHLDVVMEIFAGHKKEMEEKGQLKITPKIYEDIVTAVSGFDSFIKQDIAKLIIDDPRYNKEDYQSFMDKVSNPSVNTSKKNKM